MHIAASDCERVRPGLVAQPVNTVSSLGYSAAGVWIWWRSTSRSSPLTLTLAATAVAAGLGSVAYHGPGGTASKWAHDLSAAGLTGATIATALIGRPRGHPWLATAAAGTGIIAAALHATSRSDGPLCRPDARLQGHAVWHLLGSLAVVLLAEAVRETGPAPQRPAADRPGPVQRELDAVANDRSSDDRGARRPT